MTLAFAKSAMVLGADWPMGRVDAIFFHALSRDAVVTGSINLFDFVADLYHRGVSENIVINGSDGEKYGGNIPGESWAGKEEWVAALQERGIRGIRLAHPAFNTKEENDYFLAIAREKGWKNIGIVTVAYHFPRVMMGLVKSMERYGYYVAAYALMLKSLDWFASMHGSQGEHLSSAFGFIDGEIDRIPRYIDKGDLCTFEEFFAYLRMRNGYLSV